MKRITQIAYVFALVTLVLSIASCATTDDIDPNAPAAVDPNACLTLSTATVEGLAIRAAATRADDTFRIVTDAFQNDDVIRIRYDFTGNEIYPESNIVYARLKDNVWTLYSDLDLKTVVKLRPNPANTEESWANLRLDLYFQPGGIVTDEDGTKSYNYSSGSTTANGTICYDILTATSRSTTAGTPAAGEYSVSPNGQVTANFCHEHALLSLPQSAITISGYPQGTSVTALRGTIVRTFSGSSSVGQPEIIVFTLKPGTEAGKGTWQAIAFSSYESAIYTLKSLSVTLTKGGTSGTETETVTADLASPANTTPLRPSTRYNLSLKLNSANSGATITDAVNGWGNEEEMKTDGIEGEDYTLATKGNKNSQWTILTARGLITYRDYVHALGKDATHPNATLGTDIDLKGDATNQWTPIGKEDAYPYCGTFDGAGHTISGLYIDNTQSDLADDSKVYQGLFGILANATVKRLTVKGSVSVNVTSATGWVYIYGGGISGYVTASTLTDCRSEVDVTYYDEVVSSFTSIFVGGICGYSESISLTNCSHTMGKVSATTKNGYINIGGVAGYSDSGRFLGCTNTAEVSGSASASSSLLRIGGVIGANTAKIVACSNSGAITYNTLNALYAGGLVGVSQNTVVASFSTEVPKTNSAGSRYLGGIIGFLDRASVSACFYVNSADMGTNGIGSNGDNNNLNGGRAADPTELNTKLSVMNAAIGSYITSESITWPYRWKIGTTVPVFKDITGGDSDLDDNSGADFGEGGHYGE